MDRGTRNQPAQELIYGCSWIWGVNQWRGDNAKTKLFLRFCLWDINKILGGGSW
jgi:hypothetical protein